jgi:hypothetical protein
MAAESQSTPPDWFVKWSKTNDKQFAQVNAKIEESTQTVNERFDRLEALLLPASSEFFRDFSVLRPDVAAGIRGERAPTWTLCELVANADGSVKYKSRFSSQRKKN